MVRSLCAPALTVVTWLWSGPRDYRPEYVNILAAMFRRHLTVPHRFVCISDRLDGFGSGVEVMPMPSAADALGKLLTPEGQGFPSCYRRLWMFSSDAQCLGERVLLIDIDTVLTGNINHLVVDDADFVGWRPLANWGDGDRVGGGMYLLRTGTHTNVYEDFIGSESIAEARAAGYRGSDQAWISYKLAAHCALWPQRSGIYSIRDFRNGLAPLPRDACIVHFNGNRKPWHQHLPWLPLHWC